MINIWVEKYRPSDIDNLVGQTIIKEKLSQYIKEQEFPNLLFHGRAGTGKTSAVKILLDKIDCDYIVINASDERGIDIMREKITNFASVKSFKKIKVVVLEESENITGDAAKAFKMILEQYYKTTRFILTTNHKDRMYEPILSRVQSYEFKPPDMQSVIDKCEYILNQEKVEYFKDDLTSLIKLSFPDMRSIIGQMQKYSINGKLVVDKELGLQEKYKEVIVALLKDPKLKSLTKIRNLFEKLFIVDYLDLYKYLFDNVELYALRTSNIIEILIEIEDHMYRSKDSLDKKMTMLACISKIIQINAGG